jgi:hypothetical protein
MAPVMVLIFGIAPPTAVGTDLESAGTTKVVGAWIHGKKGTIDKQILALMFCGSLPTEVLTLIGSFASMHAPDKVVRGDLRDARPGGQQDDRVLTMLFPGCCAPLYHSRVNV